MVHREDLAKRIGSRARYLRREIGWTIKQLAAAAGLSSPFVSRVERGQTMPSIPTLQNIANALKVDIESFFAKDDERRYAISKKDSKRRSYSLKGPKLKTIYELEALVGDMENPLMEPVLVTIANKNKELEPATHGGQEFMYVVEGKIRLTLGSRSFDLEEGDAAYWDGRLPHGAINLGSGPAKTLNVHLVPGQRTDTFRTTNDLTPEES